MDDLLVHRLSPYINIYRCRYFIETRSGSGNSLAHAAKFKFSALYSCAYGPKRSERIKGRFMKDDREGCWSGKSDDRVVISSKPPVKFLIWVLSRIPGHCIFWLDPFVPDETRHPLLDELEVIFRLGQGNGNMFIINRLQLYEDGHYQFKIKPEYLKKHRRDIAPILKLFEGTHAIRRDYRRHGFLIAEPV